MMLFYFQRLIEILPFFMKGLWMTVAVSGISLVLGTVFGLLLGIVRASGNRLLVGIIGAYVAVIRGTPFVVQIFIVFFILPEWGIQLEAFPAAILSLTILGTAFICEIVAGGIKAVPRGQWEAAASSGLTIYQQLRHVIVPQSLQTILPPLVGQYVLLIKDSSVVSVIGVVELTRVGWVTVVRIPEGLMVFSLVGILYFVISYPLIRLSNTLEKKMATQQVML
ncbi:amino acid ABC transporter permease [Desulfosarcina alkanivorans]|uniref:Amino acid ABC transporter permease n=1 Tax=Desulfosarcina alkanivorans TaxID=571177 RepID=A0A5K7YIY0_9BACT|nr:amino acid ABC transporter permease [Desulfosarcina alkanivorans]BBO68345.1 amino acid ABC transporter permease [Desulfosarcina alkanivorans]